MTDEELYKLFLDGFEQSDCWSPSCELRDCCDCSYLRDCFEEFKGAMKNES